MKKHTNSEHGTTLSYFIGFILSLIFSFIPYYMVVEEVVTGSTLYMTILSFALVQMIIQVTFFLHLGRGPKPNWNLFFFGATLVVILMVVGGSVFIIDNLHYNMSPSDKIKKIVNDENIYQVGGELTGACQQTYTNNIVTISKEVVYPQFTSASKCDTITFINLDEEDVLITFGEHDNHSPYAGEVEVEVSKGRNETITLSEPGTYQYHNHYNEETSGIFTVSP